MIRARAWRLLDTGARSAAENVAFDQSLILGRSRGSSPNTLRFLQFSPPAVLVGFHQCIFQEVRSDYCAASGIEINRRLTGGGAIFFDETQLGWEIIASRKDRDFDVPPELLSRKIGEAVALGLQREFGLQASFRPRNDIEVMGRKISGTGGTEEGDAFLFQGTLLVDFDAETMLKALRVPLEKLQAREIESVKERVTDLKTELGYTPPLSRIKEAIARGMEETLGITLNQGELAAEEEENARDLVPFFSSSHWIDRIHAFPLLDESLRFSRRTPGGVVRVGLSIDPRGRILQGILVTGDFFCFPRVAIFELESRLRFVRAEENQVIRIARDFLHERKPHFPYLTYGQFLEVLRDALRRKELLSWGFSLKEINSLFFVCGEPAEIMGRRLRLLLLPYCAKLPGCEFRHRKGCSLCGLCNMGEAFLMAQERGMEVISIQDYEDLVRTLKEVRGRIEGFVGCCCEAFYLKHSEDFQRIGLPGILVDLESSTCYDLGKAGAAYRGDFENQTALRLDLLAKVLDIVAPGKNRNGSADYAISADTGKHPS